MTVSERKRPVVAALYREALPPRLAEVEELAEVRLTEADGLAKAMDGADVLYQWHSFSPALKENWGAASSLKWIHVTAAGVSQLLFDELIHSDVTYTNSRGVLSTAIAEFALGFVLDMAKDAQGSFRLQQQQRWQHRITRKIQGQEPSWWAPVPSGVRFRVYSGLWVWKWTVPGGNPVQGTGTSTGSTRPASSLLWFTTMTTSCWQHPSPPTPPDWSAPKSSPQ